MQDQSGCVAVGCSFLRRAVVARPCSEGGQTPPAVLPLFVEQLMDELILLGFVEDFFDFRGCPEAPDSVVQVLLRELIFQIAS